MKKIIIDDTYAENIREPRFYDEYAPALRSLARFKVIELEDEEYTDLR